MKIMTVLATVLVFTWIVTVSPAAAQNEALTPAPDPSGEVPVTGEIAEEAVPEDLTAEEYFPPEESPGDAQLIPMPESAPEPTPSTEALDPGAWDLSVGTEILVFKEEDGYWHPASIADVSAGMFTVRYFDPGKPDEVLDREDFRVQALTEGMMVKFYAEVDELIDGVIVARQDQNCSVALKVDGSVRDVACGTIVVPSP